MGGRRFILKHFVNVNKHLQERERRGERKREGVREREKERYKKREGERERDCWVVLKCFVSVNKRVFLLLVFLGRCECIRKQTNEF